MIFMTYAYPYRIGKSGNGSKPNGLLFRVIDILFILEVSNREWRKSFNEESIS
jgi:hypothetical protein